MTKLRQLQLLEKDILDYFVAICNENNLDYWLDFGTLLGAIRHKGFIPWDDDIDIEMPKKDYEKFIEIFNTKHKNEDYKLGIYKNRFLKIIHKKAYIIDDKNQKNEISIDIFPFEYYTSKPSIKILDMLFIEIHKNRKNKSFFTYLYNIGISIRKAISKRVIRTSFISSLFEDKNEIHSYIGRSICTNFKINLTESANIFPLTFTNFEGSSYKIPNNYDLYLKNLYGDYKILPPENERSYHQIVNDIFFQY